MTDLRSARPFPHRLATAVMLALGLALAGCGGASDAGSADAGSTDTKTEAGSASWSFTDDLGRTVTLDERPERIAGLSDVVASLWNYGIEPVAVFGYQGVSKDERFAGHDTSRVAEVGRAYGEINLESLAAARPDLIVTNAYAKDSSGELDEKAALYGFKDVAQQQAVEKIAPIVAIAMTPPATKVIERTAELAVSLGASRDSGPLADSKADYDAAAKRLSAAGEAGLKVMAVAAYPDEGLYVAKPGDDPMLNTFQDLGLDVVDLGGDNYYWTIVSWENIGKAEADVVLYSQRAMDDKAMQKQPTFAATPAAEAGQVYPWVFASMDYPAVAAYMTELAGYLERSEKVT
jgi:iron complex transport system substrate-binding protein